MKVIITGGGSGLGKSIVERFAQDEQNTILFSYYSADPDSLDALTAQKSITALHCDFGNTADLANLTQQAVAFGADLLVNSSWLNLSRKHFHRFESAEVQTSFNKNLAPTIDLSRHLLKSFKKRRAGKIINILSSATIGKPPVGMSIYTAEKAYIQQLSKAWVAEFGGFGIAINNILPGFMATNMNADVDERIVDHIKDATPNRELLTTQELAQTVYLLSQMPTQVTGNNVVVNGGEVLPS